MFNQFSFEIVIIAAWLIFFAVWLISAFWAKPDVKDRSGRGSMFFWLWRIVLVVFLVFVLRRGGDENSAIDFTLFHVNVTVGWLAAVLTVAGIGIAIWARYYLGRNWSSHPTHKEHHDLITGGPYKWVRHPIYTGILLALFGSAIIGSVFAVIMFVILIAVFIARVDKEERIMISLFPDQYPAYQKRSKRLIPWVW